MSLFYKPSAVAATSVTWETASDWDSATDESGVVHESTADTDHDDATIVKQGYSAASPIEPSNLVLYYPMHDASGPITDFSGNNYDGSLTGGPTLDATGLLGTSAISFDGSDDFIDPGTMGSFGSNMGTSSMSTWFKSDDDSASCFFAFFNENDSTAWNVEINEEQNPNSSPDNPGQVRFVFRDSGGDILGGKLDFEQLFNDGKWHHFCVSIDASSNEIICVYDGSQRSIDYSHQETPSNFTDIETNKASVGSSSQAVDFFTGDLWNFQMWDRQLSVSEFQAIHDVVATQGSLTTTWQSMDAEATTLATDSSIPANTSIDVTVEQDTNNDDSADNTQTVALSGGSSETNSLSGFSDTTGRYRVVLNPDQTDDVSVSSINSIEVQP